MADRGTPFFRRAVDIQHLLALLHVRVTLDLIRTLVLSFNDGLMGWE